MRHVALRLTFAVAVAVDACGGARAAIESLPPLALRGTNPRWISGGVYSALAAEGRFGGLTLLPRARADGVTDISKGKPPAVLDARVGVNIRLGADPSALPATQRGQAEPHIARSTENPDLLLATFQEGRFASGGGSADCGYALSRDGGFTWTRALIPQLTTASGGLYRRATDPVAGIGPQGDLYLTTLGSLDDAFGSVDLVVCRSMDGGANWSAPVVAFHQTNAQAAPDKNWLAINDYSGAANLGRLVATWTNFTSTTAGAATGNNLLAAVSDDRGATWSAPIAITPAGSLNQGSQPLFLPDGSLDVIYVTFPNLATSLTFSIQCKRSIDGGLSYPAGATTIVSNVAGYNDPDLRNGLFLPSATVARTTGEIFVTYVTVVAGTPRVMVTKSSDQGATWTTPVVASDNPTRSAVDNPAIAVTPDGQTVSVLFLDKRNSPVTPDGHAYFIDHYAAQSFDGGATWQPNLRLSELTSDVRYAPLTSEGYMLGDYLAIAPSLATDSFGNRQPCVSIWCDTRTGDADPFVVRLQPNRNADFGAWALARGLDGNMSADSDHDGIPDFQEYIDGTESRQNDSGEALVVHRSGADTVDVFWTERPSYSSAVGFASFIHKLSAPDLTSIATPASPLSAQLTGDQLPTVTPRPGLIWRGSRISAATGTPTGFARGFRVSLGLTQPTQGDPAATSDTDSRLINLSTRGPIRPGGEPMIAGFVTRGAARSALIRGVGPTLATFGLTDFAADPSLLLLAVTGSPSSAQNNDWQSGGLALVNFIAGTAATVGAFPLRDTKEAALVFGELPAATYSAQLRNVATTGGSTGLVEIYDASQNSDGLFVNLSTRGEVAAPDNALIAGFVIGGTQPRRVLIRAIGPSLAQFGVANPLVDPVLTLYRGNTVVATNDDWEISRSSAAVAATAQNIGAFALKAASLDSALLLTLAPGAYTAVVTGANGATGTALVEVYDAN